MDSGDERRLLRFLERIADALERISPPPVVVTVAPVVDMKDTVTAVRLRRDGRRLPDGPDDRGLTRGGIPPEEFWTRREP